MLDQLIEDNITEMLDKYDPELDDENQQNLRKKNIKLKTIENIENMITDQL